MKVKLLFIYSYSRYQQLKEHETDQTKRRILYTKICILMQLEHTCNIITNGRLV